MLDHSRTARHVAAALAVSLALLLGGEGTGHGADPPGVIHLDQGWSPDQVSSWYHVSQGTAFLPFQWFIALEEATTENLFAAPDHLAQLGFLQDNTGPAGLPVGFAVVQALNFPTADPYKFYAGDWIGFACAACHTGELRYNGQAIRIDGGPAHLDLERFNKEFVLAVVAPLDDTAKLQRFVDRVLKTDSSLTEDELKAGFRGVAQVIRHRAGLVQAARQAAVEPETPSGPGRLDAIHRGGNAILAAPLDDAGNYALNTSPVRYPAIWDTPYLDWVLYDASIRQPLARNIVEALGVGAPLDPQTMLSNNVVHGVLMDNIVQVHRALKQLKSPRWPDSIPIDAAKVARGSTLYDKHCAECHAVIDRQSHLPSAYSRGGPDPIKVVMVPLDKILTDPRQAVTLATRFVSLKNVGGPEHILYTDAVQTVTGAIVDQWKNQSKKNAADEQDVNGGRPDEIRAPLAYRARPLNGIWATAPYLHNGSVPSLYALLLPQTDHLLGTVHPPQAIRPASFCTGGWEFDPVNVGLKADGPCEARLQFNPLLPGNSNAGHEYGTGTDLSEADRMALIEYLKTL